MTRRILLSLLSVGFAMLDASCGGADRTATTASTRPPLVRHQGRYFSYAMPKGWRLISESTNGVTMRSPDGKQEAAYVLLLRSMGQCTPEQFGMRIGQMMQYQNFRVVVSNRLPNQPRGVVASEMEFTFTDPQLGPRHAGATLAITMAWGMYDAYWQWFSSTPDLWEKSKLWLPAIARGIVITNTREVAGNNTLIPPRNNPLDNSGLIASWKEKGRSWDRISQHQQEATMGYDRVESSTTGKYYDMPYELYDRTKGGYHNPDRPDEILYPK